MKLITFSPLMLIGLFCATSYAAAPPEKLALPDLVNHPDRWPSTVSMQRDLHFKSGAVVHAGDEARVLEFDGAKIALEAAGKVRFKASPEDCGFIEAANEAWTALTPAQRAIDPDSLIADPSLWPDRVSTTAPISCNFGNLPTGTEVGLINVARDGLEVAWPNTNNRLGVDFSGTDILALARERAALDPDKRSSRIAAALQGIVVDGEGKPLKTDLGDKKIFALYFGAGWCPPCRVFSPGFVKFVGEEMPRHPELAVILMSNDQKTEEMLAYMKEEKMPFPAVPLKDLNQSPVLLSYAAQTIPELVIVDRFGKILASNDNHQGNRVDPKETIAALAKILAAQAPAKK